MFFYEKWKIEQIDAIHFLIQLLPEFSTRTRLRACTYLLLWRPLKGHSLPCRCWLVPTRYLFNARSLVTPRGNYQHNPKKNNILFRVIDALLTNEAGREKFIKIIHVWNALNSTHRDEEPGIVFWIRRRIWIRSLRVANHLEGISKFHWRFLSFKTLSQKIYSNTHIRISNNWRLEGNSYALYTILQPPQYWIPKKSWNYLSCKKTVLNHDIVELLHNLSVGNDKAFNLWSYWSSRFVGDSSFEIVDVPALFYPSLLRTIDSLDTLYFPVRLYQQISGHIVQFILSEWRLITGWNYATLK